MPAPDAPPLSVVVPVYGQWDLIPELLAALAAQTLAQDRFEILIVDNGPPGTAPMVALPGNARRLPCAAPGSYAARNAGAGVARGTTLVFTDADCRPEPGWLADLAAAAEAAPGSLLAGPVRMVSGEPPTACEIYERLRGIPQARYVRLGYAATANLAVPAAVFRGLGGFDAARFSGGDAEFCRRAGRAGHPLRLVPGAEVAHPCRADWAELAAKARRVKGGQVAAGPLPRRAFWVMRTLTPPLRAMARFLRADAPAGHRLRAIGMLFALWGVELAELGALATGRPPRRS